MALMVYDRIIPLHWGFIGELHKVDWTDPHDKPETKYYRERHPRVEWTDGRVSDEVLLELLRSCDDQSV
jgi:hypothetical protein